MRKVNSQVNIDEKTGKVVSTTDSDIATNIDGDDDKVMNRKILKLQTSSSLPDLQADAQNSTPSSTGTISSNSNNQMQVGGHGKHVILVESREDEDDLNQIDGAMGGDGDHPMSKQKIILNIDPLSNGSSSSTSSNNLEYGNVTNTSTL